MDKFDLIDHNKDNKIPTAEEVLNRDYMSTKENAIKAMIKFAKLHVEECKKEISELVNERLKDEAQIRDFLIDGSSILKTYSLENIK
jgi:hypothetical protein